MKKNYEMIAKGETVFLKSDLHDAVIKISKGETLVKFEGKEPFVPKEGNKIVNDAMTEDEIITEAEFKAY